MRLLKSFSSLTKFEWLLWIISISVTTASFLIASDKDY